MKGHYQWPRGMSCQFTAVFLLVLFLSLVLPEAEVSCSNVKWQFATETIPFKSGGLNGHEEPSCLQRPSHGDIQLQRHFLSLLQRPLGWIHLLSDPHPPRAGPPWPVMPVAAGLVLKPLSLHTCAFTLLHQHCLTFNHILNDFGCCHHGNIPLSSTNPHWK